MDARNSAAYLGGETVDITKSGRKEASHIYRAFGSTLGGGREAPRPTMAHIHILINLQVSAGLII